MLITVVKDFFGPLDADFASIRPRPTAGYSRIPQPAGRMIRAPSKRYLRAAGRKLGLGDIGWHTFRHTYRSLLDSVGAPVGVQQKLLRHADIRTTMNTYGDALMGSKREANSKVVRMVLSPLWGKQKKKRPEKSAVI